LLGFVRVLTQFGSTPWMLLLDGFD
jgi:hypothetical protein